jgi:cell division protein ZipA
LGDVDETVMLNQFTQELGVTLSSSGVLAAEEHLDAQSKSMQEVGVSSQEKLVLTEPDEPYIANRSDEQSVSAKHDVQESSKPTSKKKEWDIILALTIVALEGLSFSGEDIAAALKSVNMEAGEMDVFHRHLPGQKGQTLFSIANMLAPGTLKPMALPTLETQGLMVFMRLPSPTNGLLVFDAMLEAADKIAKQLSGQLRDEHRQKLTEATLEKMRSRILNFNLTQQSDNDQFKHDYSN